MRKSIKVSAPYFAPHIFVKYVNSGRCQFPLFPQSPENPVKSGYLEASEIMEFYPDLLLTEGSLVRAQQGEPEKKHLLSQVLFSTIFVPSERVIFDLRSSDIASQ